MLQSDKIRKYATSIINTAFYLYKLYKCQKNQFISHSELRRRQIEKLKTLLYHAYNKVNYYRKLFDVAVIKPDNINSLEDLGKIPITDRKNVQCLGRKEIIASNRDINKCTNLKTSGSMGIPLDIFIDGQDKLIRRLFIMRMYFTNGRKVKDKVFVITSSQNFLMKQWFYPIAYNLRFLREKYISLKEDTENILKTISYYQPDIIIGLPSILTEIAWKIKERNIRDIAPRMIFLSGELLTKQDREFIASTFQAEVFDYYSCNECGVIAWECKEHRGYHINIENVIVEFIKEDGTKAKYGEEGEIVITSLNSLTMPFIRYKLGDIGVPSDEKCPCGRTLPLMKIIAGRSNGCIISSCGRKISPYFITCSIENIPGISQYQMIQERKDRVRISIVKNENFSHKTSIEIRKNCKVILGNDVEIDIIVVEKMPSNKTGKFQAIKSELQ